LLWFYGERYVLIGAAVFCLLLSVVTFIFLMCAAGHRKGREEVVLNLQDRIPFDLYLCAAGFCVVVLAYGATELGRFSYDVFFVAVAGLLLVLAGLVVLAVCMTLATRVKTRTVLRNTVLWRCAALLLRVFRFIRRELVETFQNIPAIWRAALIFCGATIINVLLAWGAFWGRSGGFLMVGFVFNFLLLVAVCRLARSLNDLKLAGERLAEGNLDYKVDTARLRWDFKTHGENLNAIGDGMSIAVNQKMRSERLKTELITNVSHDLKTPLTSIVNYVDLMKKEQLEGRAAECLEVLDRQSNRLKKLTEDLVEASKASTGNIALALTRTDVAELVNQAVGEYAQRLEEAGLEAVVSLPAEEVFIRADGRLIWRVFDNLLNNACKYAQPGTRLYVDVQPSPAEVTITMKNISRDKLNLDAEELMERFVRGESSRTAEGSGLGLNIARSLVELQKGRFHLSVDGDLFKVESTFPRQI
ncbi:MAG: HAMP domain-containing histidine kinase, partial [Clostridiales bacterium]|nr:HAMP domain-containing histidine kinase [Clostridiales bacterium]